MRIPAWRLVVTGAATAVLAVAGMGLVAASQAPAAPAAAIAAADPSGGPDDPAATEQADGERDGLRARWGGARLLRLGRHLVHVEATVVGRDDELIVVHIDHGTVQSIGGDRLVIAEAGGDSETVSLNAKTDVYVGREDGELADVTVGAEVFVQSRVDGSTVLAKRILVIPVKDS